MISHPYSGFYIAFEGIDHSGKSTQYQLFLKRLKKEFPNREIVATREPGGTPMGERIRKILLSKNELKILPLPEAHLFAASRGEGIPRIIIPALERGAVVVSDRCYAASETFQGAGRGLGIEFVRKLNEEVINGIFPNKIVVCDVTAEMASGRKIEGELDRIEREKIDFHQRVRRAYLFLAKQNPEQFLVVDGSRPREKIAEIIWKEIAPLMVNDEINIELRIKRGRE